MICHAHTLQGHLISPSEHASFSLLVETAAGRWSARFPTSHGQWAIGLETKPRPSDPKPSTKSPWPNGASLNQDVKGQPQTGHRTDSYLQVKYCDSLKSVISRGSKFLFQSELQKPLNDMIKTKDGLTPGAPLSQ